jgi:hypothetical protein
MVRVNACRAVCPTPSRTCRVNVLVWSVVGVPKTYAEYTPYDGVSERPAGRLPAITLQV